jgi:aldehyde:ferredoxin oxidoreductase
MASQYGGYMGRVLDVDLTSGKVGTYDVPDSDREKFLGGKALGAKILWDLLPPGIDPLSPENILVFTTGPFNGTDAPCSSRYNLTTKNVLTGGIASANSGGHFGIHLKRAGYDGLIVRGRAKSPSRIDIDGEHVTVTGADGLWGKDAIEVQEGFDSSIATMAIGPAGENLVRFAAILCGERAFGRCGVGAVMGSKGLKLVTAKGMGRPSAREPEKYKGQLKKWVELLKKHSVTGRQLPRFGTAGLITATNATRTLGAYNFRQGTFDGADAISGETMANTILLRNIGCPSCPIRCGREVEYKGRKVKGPEFETLGLLGANIGNADLAKIVEWNYLCDSLGMDTMSAGATLACAMELEELGHLSGTGLKFGSPDGVSAMLEAIAIRKGIGDRLAEGALRLAESCGKPEYAMQSKGMEVAAYEPRGAVGHGLGYATSNRGGCHINGGYLIFLEALGPVTMDPHTIHAKPELTVMQQNLMEAVSASGNCIFTTYAVVPDVPASIYNPHGRSAKVVDRVLQGARFVLGNQGKMKASAMPIHPPFLPHTRALTYLTGMNLHMGNFTAVGERGFTLERLFNLREGLMAESDALPPRLTDTPQDPANPDSRVRLKEMLPRYYHVRDWDESGVPRARLLEKLGLAFAAEAAQAVRDDPDACRARLRALRQGERAVLTGVLKANRKFAR